MTHHATYPDPPLAHDGPPAPGRSGTTPVPSGTAPSAAVSAPDVRVGALAGVAGVQTAGMHEPLMDEHTRPTGVPTAGATPGAAGAAPVTAPAAPGASEGVPGARRLGWPRRPGDGREGVPTAGAAQGTAGADPATGEATGSAGGEAAAGGGRVSRRVLRAMGWVALLGMIPVAGVGFAASYDTLRAAAERAHFSHALSYWIPVGIDGAIIAFLALDLYLVARRIPWPLLRFAAHGMTLATVVLNASTSAGGRISVNALWHGLMPILFVVGVEAVRRLVLHITRLEAGEATDRIPLHRWLLSPAATGRLYRRMRLANVRSYPEMIRREQDLHGYRVWLTQELGGDLSKASEVQRLPMTMAPRGYTVDEALALPARWQAEAAERTRQEEERQALAEAEAVERKAELEIKKAEAAGRVEAARYRVEAETGTAAADADAVTADARARAEVARVRAEQVRVQAERRAEAETLAARSAEAAALLRKAAEDEQAAEKAAADAEAERRRRLAEQAEADRLEAEAEADRTSKAQAEADRIKAEAEAEENRARAAEARRRAAAIAAEAQSAEDWLALNPRQRKARQVARMVVAAGGSAENVDVVPLADIEALGASRTTAGELRQEAQELLAQGYDPATAYDPQR